MLLLMVLALAVLLFWQMAAQTQRPWVARDAVDITLAGDHYRLSLQQLAWLESFSAAHFSGSADEARQIVATQIAARLDSTFLDVSARLPLFADWYYSLKGEYSRLSMAALSAMDLAEGDFVARRAAEILFPDQAWTEALNQLDGNVGAVLAASYSQSRGDWYAELQQRLSAQKVPAPIPGLTDVDSAPDALVFDALVAELQLLQQDAVMNTRLSLSTMGAAGVAGPALWRVATARASANAANAAASRGVGRAVGRGAAAGASRVGGAATGAVVCLPGGPIALACAAVAGVATWVATDWLLLQVDEVLNRDELLAGLDAGLVELRSSLETELLQAYDESIAAWQDASIVAIRDTFSPGGRPADTNR